MSHSVVEVTDSMLNDSLLLLVGEDGIVSPDKQTVETILNSRNGPTDIQVMRFNKLDRQGVDVTIDKVTYVPDSFDGQNADVVSSKTSSLEEVAETLFNVKLDHDYTSFCEFDDDDDLEKTLTSTEDSPLKKSSVPSQSTLVKNDAQSIIAHTGKAHNAVNKTPISEVKSTSTSRTVNDTKITLTLPSTFAAAVSNQRPKRRQRTHPKTLLRKSLIEDHDEEGIGIERIVSRSNNTNDSHASVNDELIDDNDDDNADSDFEFGEVRRANKQGKPRKRISMRTRKRKSIGSSSDAPNENLQTAIVIPEAQVEVIPPKITNSTLSKPISKKEKKTPKPTPVLVDDFALFSTPDIIRRVDENKPKRLSIDSAMKPLNTVSQPSIDAMENKSINTITENEQMRVDQPQSIPSSVVPSVLSFGTDESLSQSSTNISGGLELDPALLENINSDMISEDILYQVAQSLVANTDIQNAIDKSLTDGNLVLDPAIEQAMNGTPTMTPTPIATASSPEALRPTGVIRPRERPSIQPSQHSQSRTVSTLQQMKSASHTSGIQNTSPHAKGASRKSSKQSSAPNKAMHIVRSDGRVVVIPPIERPTTRSRNRSRQESSDDQNSSSSTKSSGHQSKFGSAPKHKPLDEDHVSGNELDDDSDVEQSALKIDEKDAEWGMNDDDLDDLEEEESEDDPNKLWCVCSQPHNNRFMICCDTCEEWYHGKCVNITKAMGHQMEQEGREWICLFCKNPNLKRPLAAMRRLRKTSRTSDEKSNIRQKHSTSIKKTKPQTPPAPIVKASYSAKSAGAVPCVVCQKPSRPNSIFCSEKCILEHAQGVERVVVFDRNSGQMLKGNKAPSAANLDKWLKEHPGYEVVTSAGKVLTTKSIPPKLNSKMVQSKLRLIKNTPERGGLSLAVQKQDGGQIGVLKHSPKQTDPEPPTSRMNTPAKQITIPASISAHTTTPTSNQSTVSNKEKHSPLTAIPVKTPKARQAEVTSTPSPKQQETFRENVQRSLFEQLTNRLKMVDDLKLPEAEVKAIATEVESQLFKCFGDTGQKYKNKYRSLIYNIKDSKNQTFWRRICDKSINAYQVVRLSPDDMASQELALWREREAKHQLDMIKKNELELLSCNRKYLVKTHKGEEVLEENRANDTATIDSSEVITSLTDSNAAKASDDTSRDKKSSSKHAHKDERKSNRDKDRHRRRSRSHERNGRHGDRKSSKSRDRDARHKRSSHKNSKHKRDSTYSSESSVNNHRSNDLSADSAATTTDKLDKKSKEILEQLVGNKIVPPLEDGIWSNVGTLKSDISATNASVVPTESDSDHEPTSTVTIPTPPRSEQEEAQIGNKSEGGIHPNVEKSTKTTYSATPPSGASSPIDNLGYRPKPVELWRGRISMVDVTQISLIMQELWGECDSLIGDLPVQLDIVGRISPDTVWEYISKMKASSSKEISIVRLWPRDDDERNPYNTLYKYLSRRSRMGVIKTLNKNIKDFYIYPLAPNESIPPVLLFNNQSTAIVYGLEGDEDFSDSEENGSTRPPILIGIIVRERRKRMSTLPYVASDLPSITKRPKLDAKSSFGIPKVAVETSEAAMIRPSSPLKPVVASDLLVPAKATKPTIEPQLQTNTCKDGDNDGDEPYSPGDSDQDAMIEPTKSIKVPPATTAIPTNSSLLPGHTIPLNLGVPPPPLPVAIQPPPIDTTIPPPPLPPAILPAPPPPPPPPSEQKTILFDEKKVATTFQPFANKFDEIPGLENPVLPSNTQEIQRQMEELNKEIEMQKSQINSISQTLATASTEIGVSALASIALPSNLQQILDNIKTITTVPDASTDATNSNLPSGDLTMPLILPNAYTSRSTRMLPKLSPPIATPIPPVITPSTTKKSAEEVIPPTMVLPPPPIVETTTIESANKLVPATAKSAPKTTATPSISSVLSTLSEEDLIRKAAEMLAENDDNAEDHDDEDEEDDDEVIETFAGETVGRTTINTAYYSAPPQLKRQRIELNQPPIPGLEDDFQL